jgi:hypothetical protein
MHWLFIASVQLRRGFFKKNCFRTIENNSWHSPPFTLSFFFCLCFLLFAFSSSSSFKKKEISLLKWKENERTNHGRPIHPLKTSYPLIYRPNLGSSTPNQTTNNQGLALKRSRSLIKSAWSRLTHIKS